MKGFMKLFKKAMTPEVEERLNIEELDHSLNLLRSTTLEVSEAAVCAAGVLSERLKESQTRFFSTIDAVNDIIMIKDNHNRWKTLNTQAQKLFGITYDQWVGKSNEEVMMEMPHLRECLTRCSDKDEQAWESKQPIRMIETMSVDGVEKVFDVVKTPTFYENGSRKELIIISRDITEIRNVDRRMNACFTALNYASDCIVVLDNKYNVVFSNDSFNDVFGTEHEGRHFKQVLPGFRYFAMAKSVVQNKPWKGSYDGYTVNVMPVMNGSPIPVHYICTFKKNALESVQSA